MPSIQGMDHTDDCDRPLLLIASALDAFESALPPELREHLAECDRCRMTIMISLVQVLAEVSGRG